MKHIYSLIVILALNIPTHVWACRMITEYTPGFSTPAYVNAFYFGLLFCFIASVFGVFTLLRYLKAKTDTLKKQSVGSLVCAITMLGVSLFSYGAFTQNHHCQFGEKNAVPQSIKISAN